MASWTWSSRSTAMSRGHGVTLSARRPHRRRRLRAVSGRTRASRATSRPAPRRCVGPARGWRPGPGPRTRARAPGTTGRPPHRPRPARPMTAHTATTASRWLIGPPGPSRGRARPRRRDPDRSGRCRRRRGGSWPSARRNGHRGRSRRAPNHAATSGTTTRAQRRGRPRASSGAGAGGVRHSRGAISTRTNPAATVTSASGVNGVVVAAARGRPRSGRRWAATGGSQARPQVLGLAAPGLGQAPEQRGGRADGQEGDDGGQREAVARPRPRRRRRAARRRRRGRRPPRSIRPPRPGPPSGTAR